MTRVIMKRWRFKRYQGARMIMMHTNRRRRDLGEAEVEDVYPPPKRLLSPRAEEGVVRLEEAPIESRSCTASLRGARS